ncbi:MAG: Tfp pilus assembly protein FimT/FimU [Nitrospinota bacterium]
MHRSERGREGGFSLIEVILVIMLVGIISAVAIPRFRTIPKVGAVATRLVSDIRYAKQLANRTQTLCGVYFIDSSSYRVFQNNDTNNAALSPATGTDFVVTLSGSFSGVTVSANFGDTLKFDSLGTPLDGSDNPLTTPPKKNISVTEGTDKVTIRVEPSTGMVHVQ